MYKPTNNELNARIARVADLLSHGLTRTQVHEACKQEWGVGWRTSERYMARAREFLVFETKMDRTEHVAMAYQYYASILRSPRAEIREKLIARERMDKLLGLEVPFRAEVNHTAIDPVKAQAAFDKAWEAKLKFAAILKAKQEPNGKAA